MLKDLQARRREVRQKALEWEGIIDRLGGEPGKDESAADVASASFEIRARAFLYRATEPFEEFDAALGFLLMMGENARRKIRYDAKAVGLDFASALPRSRNTVELLREIAKALTLLTQEEAE